MAHLSGIWCSGITSASHAEGPGFEPRRLQRIFGLMSAIISSTSSALHACRGPYSRTPTSSEHVRPHSFPTMFWPEDNVCFFFLRMYRVVWSFVSNNTVNYTMWVKMAVSPNTLLKNITNRGFSRYISKKTRTKTHTKSDQKSGPKVSSNVSSETRVFDFLFECIV